MSSLYLDQFRSDGQYHFLKCTAIYMKLFLFLGRRCHTELQLTILIGILSIKDSSTSMPRQSSSETSEKHIGEAHNRDLQRLVILHCAHTQNCDILKPC